MTLEESREIIPLMESMIGQIEEQQNLMAEIDFWKCRTGTLNSLLCKNRIRNYKN